MRRPSSLHCGGLARALGPGQVEHKQDPESGERYEQSSRLRCGTNVLPGKDAEVTQVWPMAKRFVDAVGRGVMKLLAFDRGLIDGKTCLRAAHTDASAPSYAVASAPAYSVCFTGSESLKRVDIDATVRIQYPSIGTWAAKTTRYATPHEELTTSAMGSA